MVVLTEHYIVSRTRCASVETVTKLNVWGQDVSDITMVKRMSNLQVLSLSVNKIYQLEPLSHCANLRELYMRKNKVSDIREVLHLQHCKLLSTLWMSENPCTEYHNYRLTVIRALPSLTKLDNIIVTDLERERAKIEGDNMEITLINDVVTPDYVDIVGSSNDKLSTDSVGDAPIVSSSCIVSPVSVPDETQGIKNSTHESSDNRDEYSGDDDAGRDNINDGDLTRESSMYGTPKSPVFGSVESEYVLLTASPSEEVEEKKIEELELQESLVLSDVATTATGCTEFLTPTSSNNQEIAPKESPRGGWCLNHTLVNQKIRDAAMVEMNSEHFQGMESQPFNHNEHLSSMVTGDETAAYHRSQQNVTFAILKLLEELNRSSLATIASEIQKRLSTDEIR